MRASGYDKLPSIPAAAGPGQCWRGWESLCAPLNAAIAARSRQQSRVIVAIECYTGLHEEEVEGELRNRLPASHFLRSRECFKSPDEVDRLVAPDLGDDPVFGRYTSLRLEDFLDESQRRELRRGINELSGIVVVYGAGAVLCCEPDLLVYADMPRWEAQLRQRRNEVANLGVCNRVVSASLKYKRSIFVDWPVLDRLKQATIGRWDYLLDTTMPGDPKLISGEALRATLDAATRRPFRVVPYFDPAPWGGQWMKERFGLDPMRANYGWGFDCVPEENSLLLKFDEAEIGRAHV